MSRTKIQTLDQQRAAHAWDAVQRIHQNGGDAAKKFGIQTKKLPTRIMAAGLGQALAFLVAKEIPDLHEIVSSWINIRKAVGSGEDGRLLVRLLRGDADFQRFATAECLAYLVWLVRFADALDLTKNTETQ